MKNQFVCILCLAIVFHSCDNNGDLMVQEDISLAFLQPKDNIGMAMTAVHPFSRDTCMDLTSVQWLSGTAALHPIPEMAQQEADELTSKRFVLEASGDAMSETLARGFSELKMIYHNNPHRITGEMVTRFYYGEVLELEFEGVSELQYENQILHMEVDVKDAILRTPTNLYILDEGSVRFSIPRHPEGSLSLDVELNIKICPQ